MKNILAILIAKSGVALLDLLPREWEVVISDHSRLDQRGVEFWNLPHRRRYDEIVILDQNVTTALTQRKVELALQGMGVEGPVHYAGNTMTRLAYLHQHYLLGREGLFTKTRPDLPSEPYTLNKYMVCLVGLPASGKTMLRKIFSSLPYFSCYKWGEYAQGIIESNFGSMTSENSWSLVQRFTNEVESRDRIAVARRFLEQSGIRQDPATFAVVDGIKRREQIIYASYATRRPAIVVRVERDETERQAECLKRGDFDDWQDARRQELLRDMGALDVMDFADFVVKTTGNSVVYDGLAHTCRVNFGMDFIAGIHELFSWLFVSSSLEQTREMVSGQCRYISESIGFQTEVLDELA